jgi:N-acetylglutamate synthase-like GNAT family acetyltransferase
MEVRIRPFEKGDVDGVKALIVGIQRGEFEIAITAEEQPDLSTIPEFYQTGVGNFWVALAGDEVVGTIGLRDITEENVALRKMFVAPDYRGEPHRLAQRLLDIAIDWSRSKKICNIYLGTTSRFLAAHRFYEKNGFDLVDPDTLPPTFPRMAVDTRFYRRSLE